MQGKHIDDEARHVGNFQLTTREDVCKTTFNGFGKTLTNKLGAIAVVVDFSGREDPTDSTLGEKVPSAGNLESGGLQESAAPPWSTRPT